MDFRVHSIDAGSLHKPSFRITREVSPSEAAHNPHFDYVSGEVLPTGNSGPLLSVTNQLEQA